MIIAAGLVTLVCSGSAEARTSGTRQALRPAGAVERTGPPEPLLAIVTLSDQHIEVYGPGGSMGRSHVSTGQSGHDTPTGVFTVLQRSRFHRSNIYSNAPMPYMQRLTWSGIALHEGHVPNYRASHGCIRLPSGFAQRFWGIARVGMRVIVTPSPTAPVAIAHERLPLPQPSVPVQQAAHVKVAVAGGHDAAMAASRQLTPYEAAQARLARAVTMKGIREQAVKPALDWAAAKAAEANRLSDALKASAGILVAAEEKFDLESQRMATVQTETAEAQVLQSIDTAASSMTAAREARDKLRRAEREASDAAFAAARAAREAQTAAEAASEELGLARKAMSPISVFVSRKTGNIYVRQGIHELYEGPVPIAEPANPLGTHVYTAMQEQDAGAALTWVSVTVPTGGDGNSARRRSERPATVQPAATAAAALDRVTMPAEVRALMSERLWPGASLIVSDFGLGETNQFTDFVILTR